MSKIIKKILIVFLMTIISICIFTNVTYAVTWIEARSYTRETKKNDDGDITHYKAFARDYDRSHGTLWVKKPNWNTIGDKQYWKLGVINASGNTIRPVIQEYNTLCLQHDQNVGEESDGITYLVRAKVNISNNSVTGRTYQRTTRNVGSNKGTDYKDVTADNVNKAATIAYIFSYSERDYTRHDDYSSILQWGAWTYMNDFFSSCDTKKVLDNIPGGLYRNIDKVYKNKDSSYYKWLHEKTDEKENYQICKEVFAEADVYQSYMDNYVSLADKTTQSSIITVQSGSNYVVGPFKVEYSRASYGDKFFGGIDVDNCKLTYGTKNTEISRNLWSFCDVNGNAITQNAGMPDNNTNFYVLFKGDMSLYADNLKLNIQEKHLNCRASFFDISSGSGYQEWSFILEGTTEYETSNININIPFSSRIKVKKIDSQTKLGLEGVEFDIKNGTTVVGTIKTDKNGEAISAYLPFGTYTIEEKTALTNYKKTTTTKQVTLDKAGLIVDGGTFENTPYGSLEIIKKDSATGNILNGMQFKIKNSSGYYITSVSKDSLAVLGTTDKNKAKTFTTGLDGIAANDGKIYIPQLVTGTYIIEEVSVGSNWQYIAGVSVQKDVIKGTNTITINNTKAYINLSGYVWEDKVEQGKGTGRKR